MIFAVIVGTIRAWVRLEWVGALVRRLGRLATLDLARGCAGNWQDKYGGERGNELAHGC